MPPKHLVRLALKINGSSTPSTIMIPSAKSDPLTIASDIWAVWPVDMELGGAAAARGVEADLTTASGGGGGTTAAAGPTLVYATAQLVARVKNTAAAAAAAGTAVGGEVLFLIETEGVPAEFAFSGQGVTALPGKAAATTEGELTVLRKITPGTAAFASVTIGPDTLSIVLLPWNMADAVWLQTLDGVERIFITDNVVGSSPELLLMAENKTLHLRTSMQSEESSGFSMFPPVSGLKHTDGSAVPSVGDGVLTAYKPTVEKVTIAVPTITHIRKAGPARNVSGKTIGFVFSTVFKNQIHERTRSFCQDRLETNIGKTQPKKTRTIPEAGRAVRKRVFLRHLYTKMIILPRPGQT
jgi:hypothetical protein